MKKKIILISSKAITVNIFLDQLIIDLKKNFRPYVYVGDPQNIKVKCNKNIINFPKNFFHLFNFILVIRCLYQIRTVINAAKSQNICTYSFSAHLVRIALLFSKRNIVYFVHGFRFHKKTNFFYSILFNY